MPYTKFVKRGSKVNVYKNGKAFTSHSPSKAKAHKTAGVRDAYAKGKGRHQRKKSSSKSRKRTP
jgi:hypothetical protein